MRFSLYLHEDVELRSGQRLRAGRLLHTDHVRLAAALVRDGLAEPNDAATAEAVELALRLQALNETRA